MKSYEEIAEIFVRNYTNMIKDLCIVNGHGKISDIDALNIMNKVLNAKINECNQLQNSFDDVNVQNDSSNDSLPQESEMTPKEKKLNAIFKL